MDPDEVETVFVAGASGGTGRAVLRLLGRRVPTVRALTRSPGKRDTLRRPARTRWSSTTCSTRAISATRSRTSTRS